MMNRAPTETVETLSYAPPPPGRRRLRRRLLWCATIILIGAAVWWQAGRIGRFVSDRYLAWQIYRLQTQCVAASSAEGEVVLRDDGNTNGISDAVVVPPYPPNVLHRAGFVGRSPASWGSFVRAVNNAGPSARFGMGGEEKTFLMHAMRRDTNDGQSRMATITVRASGTEIEIRSNSAPYATRWKVPLETRAVQRVYCSLQYTPSAAPLTIRRVVDPQGRAGAIGIEFGQGEHKTTFVALWTDDHYEIEIPTAVRPHLASSPIRLPPVSVEALVVDPPGRTLALPPGTDTVKAMSAGTRGLMVYCAMRSTTHRLFRLDLTQNTWQGVDSPVDGMGDVRLGADGLRLIAAVQAKADNGDPGAIDVYDFDRDAVAHIAMPRFAPYSGNDLFVSADASRVAIGRLRTPIYVYDMDAQLVRTIANERADDMFLACDRVVVRDNTGDLVSIIGVKSGVVSTPIESGGFSSAATALSPDARTLAIGDGRGLSVIDTATGRLVTRMIGDRNLEILSFSPDGRWLLGQGVRHVLVVDLLDRTHARAIEIKAFDGRAAIGVDDRTLYVAMDDELRIVELERLAAP
jgi:hypothetical protein